MLIALLANLAMPLLAQGAAPWMSRGGVEFVSICTSQGVRLVPLADIAPDTALHQSPDSSRPAPGNVLGHCDACLGALNSMAAAVSSGSVCDTQQWRSPQTPLAGLVWAAQSPDDQARARGPPRGPSDSAILLV